MHIQHFVVNIIHGVWTASPYCLYKSPGGLASSDGYCARGGGGWAGWGCGGVGVSGCGGVGGGLSPLGEIVPLGVSPLLRYCTPGGVFPWGRYCAPGGGVSPGVDIVPLGVFSL